jgi:micrococcal nuclease
MRRFSLVLVLFLAIPMAAFSSVPFTVDLCIDGETLQLSNGEKIRLTGIDVPASSKNAKLRDDIKNTGKGGPALIAAGKDAAKFLRKMTKNQTVLLESDVEEKERSGRRWAYVYLPLDPGLNMEIPETWYAELDPTSEERRLRVFLNATMIKAGYARAMTIPPNVKHQELFAQMEKEAREQKRGLWRE